MTKAPSITGLLLILGVVGCGPLVQVGAGPDKQKDQFFTLGSAPAPREGAPVVDLDAASAIMVETPIASGPLQQSLIAVQMAGGDLAFLADARWADRPASLVAAKLRDAISARTDALVLDNRQSGIDYSERLSGRLSDFQLDVREMTPQVVVTYDAAFQDFETDSVAARRFRVQEDASSDRPADVAAAFSRATDQLATDVAGWVSSLRQ